MAIPSSLTRQYDALLTLTLDNIREGLFDAVFTSAAFMAALYGAYGKKKRNKKGIRMVNGGERIRVPLMYGKNSTVKSYSGYDVLDVTPQDGITAAFFNWCQLAGSVSISRKEERQNSGEAQIRDLLQAKVMQLEMSLRDETNNQLIGKTYDSTNTWWDQGDGMSDETDLQAVAMLLGKDNQEARALGNINPSTYSWWRHRVVDGSAAHGSKDANADRGFNCNSWANLEAAMRWMYNTAGRGGGGSPDLILTDQLTYESYEAAIWSKGRVVNREGGPVSIGFESIRFKGADMVWDEMIPDIDGGLTYDDSSWATGTMWFLNTDFIELVVDSQTDFISTPFVRPENQDARTAQVLLMAALTVLNRRKHGIIYGITAPITS